jgi:predicted ATPase
MPKLHAITARHYKSFEPSVRLELRPLTLLLGRNNAGKSSLLRLLPILARSASTNSAAPLDLSGEECKENDFFRDYAWQRGAELGLELEWSDGDHKLVDRYTLRHGDKLGDYIDSLTIDRDGHEPFSARAQLNDDASSVKLLGEGVEETLRFRGLCPDEDPPHDALRSLRKRLRTFGGQVQWLCSNRVAPERNVNVAQGSEFKLDYHGGNAASILQSAHDPFKALTERIADWYHHDEIKRTLHYERITDRQFRPLLDKNGHTNQRIHLLDTGEGMAQVLPVLVAAELASMAGRDAILAIEDPEDQLHENARAALAEHLAKLASGEDAPCMVLETHSRTFLLGIQLAIARGILPPEHVAAYWIAQGEDGRSEATQIHFDEFGTPKESIIARQFEQDLELSSELLDIKLTATR